MPETGAIEDHPFDSSIRYRAYGDKLVRGYDLPAELLWVGKWANNNFDTLVRQPIAFHGTRMSRISRIKYHGIYPGSLRAISEVDGAGNIIANSVFATADPTLAAWHSFYNGPEDTNNQRVNGYKDINPYDPVVILCIDVTNSFFGERTQEIQQQLRDKFLKFVHDSKSPAVEEAVALGESIPLECLSVLTHQGDSVEMIPFLEYFKNI